MGFLNLKNLISGVGLLLVFMPCVSFSSSCDSIYSADRKEMRGSLIPARFVNSVQAERLGRSQAQYLVNEFLEKSQLLKGDRVSDEAFTIFLNELFASSLSTYSHLTRINQSKFAYEENYLVALWQEIHSLLAQRFILSFDQVIEIHKRLVSLQRERPFMHEKLNQFLPSLWGKSVSQRVSKLIEEVLTEKSIYLMRMNEVALANQVWARVSQMTDREERLQGIYAALTLVSFLKNDKEYFISLLSQYLDFLKSSYKDTLNNFEGRRALEKEKWYVMHMLRVVMIQNPSHGVLLSSFLHYLSGL